MSAIGVGAFVVLSRGVVPTAIPGETPEATTRASNDPTTEPTGSATQSPAEPAPSGLVIGAWVETVVDGLNLRRQPALDAESHGLLPIGSEGTIAAGPFEVDGYDWYALAPPGLPWGSGCATGPGADGVLGYCWPFGWVAGADESGNPWLERASLACPERPTTVEELSLMRPGVRLACFGGEDLAVSAFLAPLTQGRGCYPAYRHTPEWLGPCPNVTFLQGTETEFEAEGPELVVHLSPSVGICDFGGRSPATCPFVPFIGQWINVTGHFDDPAADSCAVEPTYQTEFIPNPAEAMYLCRERFVITDIAAGAAP